MLPSLSDYLFGTLLCAAVGGAVWLLSRRRQGGGASAELREARADGGARVSRGDPRGTPTARALAIAGGALFLYLLVAWGVFGGRPLLIDELVQLLQGARFAQGRLADAAPAYPEFTVLPLEVLHNDRLFGQYPPGWSGLLALGTLLGAPWIMGPLCGAVTVWAMVRLADRATGDGTEGATGDDCRDQPGDGLWVGVALALSPFWVFQSGSMMSHVPVTAAIALALLALDRGRHFWVGVAVGVAAAIRPLDALAFAAPMGAWYLWRTLGTNGRGAGAAGAAGDVSQRGAAWRAMSAAALGVSLPLLAMVGVNLHTHRHAFEFGYTLLWGPGHGLGFHAAPFGAAHTPARGVTMVAQYLEQLNALLYETPFPSLLLPLSALLIAAHRRRLGRTDALLGAGSVLLLLSYAAYWHAGNWLGPRFVVPVTLACAWWVGRLPRLLCEAGWPAAVRRGVWAAVATGAVLALVIAVPARARGYAGMVPSLRADYAAAAREAGARDAVILVRESWGAQLAARLMGRAVRRPALEAFYAGIDACALDSALTVLEATDVREGRAELALQPLLARDSAVVVRSPFSPDDSERVRPGARYGAGCVARIEEDRAGYALYAPARLVRDSNVWARDLGDRNRLLLASYAGRPVWRLTRAGPGGRLRLERLSD